jgi:prophage regulatory protein
MQTAICLLLLHRVEERTGLKKSKIYELLREGSFPQPIRLGRRTVRWRSDDIDRWIDNLTITNHDQAA